MNPRPFKLEITIRGKSHGSGKTRMAHMIGRYLATFGFETVIHDDDDDNDKPIPFDPAVPPWDEKIFHEMGPKRTVRGAAPDGAQARQGMQHGLTRLRPGMRAVRFDLRRVEGLQ
jgi:hypothetical protein